MQTRFMPSSFVLVNESAASRAIDDRHGAGIGGLSRLFVTRLNGFYHFLDIGAHHRALTHVALPVSFSLQGAFASLR